MLNKIFPIGVFVILFALMGLTALRGNERTKTRGIYYPISISRIQMHKSE